MAGMVALEGQGQRHRQRIQIEVLCSVLAQPCRELLLRDRVIWERGCRSYVTSWSIWILHDVTLGLKAILFVRKNSFCRRDIDAVCHPINSGKELGLRFDILPAFGV